MKKILPLVIVFCSLVATLGAQDYKTGVGIRAGLPFGVTVKHFLNENNAIEGIAASRWRGLVVTGLYEFEYRTGEYPGLNWFWGAGAHLGVWGASYNPNINATYTGAVIGIDGIIGLEYTFEDIPLNLSLDILPSLNLIGYTGWGGINGALSVRYVF